MLTINLMNTRHKAVEHRRRKLWRRVDSKDSLFPPCLRETLRVRGWLQVRVKTHEYALSTRLLNGGHVALKGHRIWAREVFFTKNQVNGARIHPVPSFSHSFRSSSPPILFLLLFVIYSLFFRFSFLFILFAARGIEEEEEQVRQSWRIKWLSPFSYRERLTASSRWTTRNCASVHQGELCRALHVVLDRDGIDFRKASHCFSPRILSHFSLSLSLSWMHEQISVKCFSRGDYIVPLWNCNIAKCDETWRFSDFFFLLLSCYSVVDENQYFTTISLNERIERVSLK